MSKPLNDIQDSSPAISPVRGGVLALGNFDGVHRGHHAVIKAALDQARRLGGVPTVVLTLEPHSRSVFEPNRPPFRLTPANVKIRLLRKLGVDDVVVMDFTPEFSRMKAADFINDILVKQYAAKHVVAGFDFVFGHQRVGNMQRLRNGMAPHGIEVTEVMPCRDSQGEVMSSSRVRLALQQGDLSTARHILGRPWSISGIVEKGRQRGRTVGFPTANVDLGEYIRPKFGVYAVYARRVGSSKVFPGIANIGVRPTVGEDTELMEFYLFDFYSNIYDQEWEVELIDFLRPERTFPDLQALQAQIMSDTEAAKATLSCLHI
ncbi:MAG: bifunctional riboflavin kinase/FAD synthetase [Alphaproteobacteria bacterium]|nr:bifunctional riboflavin kinase/FAD synthetase [Alphaproteobacteria bacterium]